jgi:hypothetical protein
MKLAPLHGTAIPPNPFRWIDPPSTAMAIFKNPVGLPMPCCCSCVRGREAESHCCAFDHCVSWFHREPTLVAFAQSLSRMPCPRGTVARAWRTARARNRGADEPTPILPNYQATVLWWKSDTTTIATVDKAMSGWPTIFFAWPSCQLGCLLTMV